MYKEQTHFSTDTYKPHKSCWIIQFSFGQERTGHLSVFSHISCLLMKAKIGKRRGYIDRGCIANFSANRDRGRLRAFTVMPHLSLSPPSWTEGNGTWGHLALAAS